MNRITGISILSIMLLCVAFMFVSGCATMKKEECLAADWYQIGYEDGTLGQPASRVAKHRKACAGYDIQPDLKAYLRGREMGLKEFCTPHNGYQMGVKGRIYQDQCRGEGARKFLEAYNQGRDVYYFKQGLEDEIKNLNILDRRLKDIKKRIAKKEKVLSENCTDQDTCRRYLDEIRDLDDEKKGIEHEIYQKQHQITNMKQRLEHMETRNSYPAF